MKREGIEYVASHMGKSQREVLRSLYNGPGWREWELFHLDPQKRQVMSRALRLLCERGFAQRQTGTGKQKRRSRASKTRYARLTPAGKKIARFLLTSG